MTNQIRGGPAFLLVLCAVVALSAFAVDGLAHDEKDGHKHDHDKKAPDKKDKKAKEPYTGPKLVHPRGDHIDYKRTYLEALTEARIRNLPVFVSRHKDF